MHEPSELNFMSRELWIDDDGMTYSAYNIKGEPIEHPNQAQYISEHVWKIRPQGRFYVVGGFANLPLQDYYSAYPRDVCVYEAHGQEVYVFAKYMDHCCSEERTLNIYLHNPFEKPYSLPSPGEYKSAISAFKELDVAPPIQMFEHDDDIAIAEKAIHSVEEFERSREIEEDMFRQLSGGYPPVSFKRQNAEEDVPVPTCCQKRKVKRTRTASASIVVPALHFMSIVTRIASLFRDKFIPQDYPPEEEDYSDDVFGDFELQAGEEVADPPSASIPSKEKVSVKSKAYSKPTPKPFQPIYAPDTEFDADQAIDEEITTTGKNSSRPLSRKMTPCGMREVIHMSNTPISASPVDYNLHVPLPEWGNVWQPITKDVNDSYVVSFNDRTTRLMEFFKQFHSLAIVRIVGKIPLFQSQRFWVSWAPPNKSSPTQNNIGFEWNPSEQSEIYILCPWSALQHMETTRPIPYNSCFGRIGIIPVTDLVTEVGLPTSVEFNLYACPADMTLYTPAVVQNTSLTLLDVKAGSTVVTCPPDTNIHVIGNMAYNDNTNQIGIQENAGDKGLLNPILLDGAFEGGLQYCIGSLTPGNVRMDKGAPQIYSRVTPEDPTAHTPGYMSDTSLLPATGDLTITCMLDQTIAFTNRVIVKSYTADITESQYHKVSSVFGNGTYTVSLLPLGPPNFRRQMFEYKYNDESQQASIDYGRTSDHTLRLDTHWSKIGKANFEGKDSVAVFNVLNPEDTYAYDDRKRHLMMSKCPLVKFAAASNPSTNVMLRITQTQSAEIIPLSQALQLPGAEWDPKMGPKIWRPYWSSKFSVISDTLPVVDDTDPWSIYLQVDIIAGTVGTTFEVASWYNTTPVDYHHFIGYGTQAGARQAKVDTVIPMDTEEAEEQRVKEFAQHILFTRQGGEEQVTKTTEISADTESDSVVSRSEERWNFLTTLTLGAVATGQLSTVAGIRINSAILGQWPYLHGKRYGRWRGSPKIKAIITNDMRVNGSIHICQSNVAPVTTAKPTDYVTFNSHAVSGAQGSSIEFPIQWRRMLPWISMDGSDDVGYLIFALPIYTTTQAGKFNITLYVDVSDVTYSLAADPSTAPVAPELVVIKNTA